MAKIIGYMNKALNVLKEEADDKQTRASVRKVMIAEGVCSAVAREVDPQSVLTSFCEISCRKARVDDRVVEACRYYEFKAESASQKAIRRYCSLVLYFAWCGGDALLPVNFKMMKAVTPEMRTASPSVVLREMANYEPNGIEEKKFGAHIKQWLTQYSLSWIYCTNWQTFSDIKDDEAAQLHVFISIHNREKNGNPSSVERAVKVFAERGCICHDVEAYEAAKQAAFDSSSFQSSDLKKVDPFLVPQKGRGGGFFYIHPQLKLEDRAPSKSVVQLWERLFTSYLLHREHTGRTANERRKAGLHVLADYLAIMLPAYAAGVSETIQIPKSPKQFTRYPFVDQTYRPRSFPTYLEYLKRRGLKASTRQTNLYLVQDFFEWVELNLASQEFSEVAGPGFRCPFNKKDLPFVPRPSSTTKVPFSKEVYPLVFHFVHEVERIGMYLEANPKIASKVCNFSAQSSDHFVDLRSLDVEFNVHFQDEALKVFQIPQYLLVGTKKAKQGINLSALRLLIFMLETGLRAQSCQWLDIDSWAKHLDDFNVDDPIKLIHINSDKAGKTKDIRVLSRVIKMLDRQRDHRRSKGIPEIVFDYELRPSSPFEPLVPLFAKENGQPVSDTAYSTAWIELMVSFQGFLHQNGYTAKPVAVVKPPNETDDGNLQSDGFATCKLNWSAVHTPHAARASFVTRRSGSTDYVILADLIGHADPVVTAYYDAPEFEAVVDALEHEKRPHLDASSPISELRSQLTDPNQQTEEVIHRFGISSLRDFHGAEDNNTEQDARGVELLKSSQVSELVFRETHICPVGEMCPDDVVLAAGGPMRCGTCKLACKSVDHLPAIEAKCRALIARIQATSASLMREKRGTRDRDRLRRLHDALSVDSYQLVGWQDASVTLRRLVEEKKSEGVVAGSPEIIKRHLQRAVRQLEPAQFLVDRILDAKMYPSLSDEVLRRQAIRLARKLALSEQELFADENEEILSLYSLIKTRLKALGKTWNEAGELLEQEVGSLVGDNKSEVRLLNASA